MKQLVKNSIFAFTLMAFAFNFSSCEEENKDIQDNEELYKSIAEQFVNTTIIPTYKSLAEAALEMRTANNRLRSNPTDETMAAASDAWMKARIWWEINEAFLFGPVGESALDVDGHIDSWPLELEAIQNEIAAGGNLSGKDAWNLDAEVIGFHVTEYLLYRDGKSRKISDVSSSELNYLIAATDALVWDCVLAYVAWVGEENVSAEMKTVFNENADVVSHLNNNAAYKNFASRMKDASAYQSSFAAAVSQIFDGAIDIANEVGETKIESPYENGRVEEVESWYSWHSLDDYQNNIRSIKNAYLGGFSDVTRPSVSLLSNYVASKNAQLDRDIKAQIEDCITKIALIGGGTKSFYEVVRDHTNEGQVAAAVDACKDLANLFEQLKNIID
ncbi:MAG: hypothetical protein LBU22_01865 [Dysgonamonadaceae bacterium]|jgi:uncharacterized iron-regulated protein|nr:hypothetical protein [Dysgonamonadaceae bacterium]